MELKPDDLQALVMYCQETGATVTIEPIVTDRVRLQVTMSTPEEPDESEE